MIKSKLIKPVPRMFFLPYAHHSSFWFDIFKKNRTNFILKAYSALKTNKALAS